MPPYKIKISTREGADAKWMLRQTNDGLSRCGKYRFFLNEDVENPDFWAVRGKGVTRKETCNVAPENTMLLLSEPLSVLSYPERYRNQFGMLCSCQEKLTHRNIRYTQAILPWFVGMTHKNGHATYSQDYDTFKAMDTPPKNKLISVVTSNKAFSKGHQDRIRFVEKLKEYYGEQLDVFGRGYNPFDDKWEVLAPYKYHIAIENGSSRYYWTEKLSDCYLTETYPIYYGCTNIHDYFPDGAYTTIDVNKPEEAINTISRIIETDEFSRSLSALKQCKDLVLGKYNMFDMIVSFCEELNPHAEKQPVTLKPAISSLDWHNAYLYFVERNFYNLKMMLKNRFGKRSVLFRNTR